jgi:chemotaxis protein MotA
MESKGIINSFLSLPSAIIVIFGGLAATILTYSTHSPRLFFVGLGRAFKNPKAKKDEIIKQMVELNKLVRKSGFLAIEEEVEELDNEFMKKGLRLIIDGIEPEVIKELLNLEVEVFEMEQEKIVSIFNAYSTFLPAFGMIGTLIGLIIMLGDLSDTASLGSGMAAALITTFYGSLFANGIVLPIAKKIEYNNEQEAEVKDLIIAGIIDIQTGMSPRLMEQKLATYMSEAEKKRYFKEEELDLEVGVEAG